MLSDDEWATLGRKLTLTRRETQVLQGVFAEQKNEVIAQALGITARTVRSHLAQLFRKVGCKSRTGAVASAFKEYVRTHPPGSGPSSPGPRPPRPAR